MNLRSISSVIEDAKSYKSVQQYGSSIACNRDTTCSSTSMSTPSIGTTPPAPAVTE
ncbi:unnamed protein product [Dovyalis caffra]|uniref:Uncharacterized protein n=1 Tax=Dovyalis caffra TaxID=77055 RepID=A0AAV1S8E0_9ROSI|nr:unnamed protein product [Dovyalis caffra]